MSQESKAKPMGHNRPWDRWCEERKRDPVGKMRHPWPIISICLSEMICFVQLSRLTFISEGVWNICLHCPWIHAVHLLSHSHMLACTYVGWDPEASGRSFITISWPNKLRKISDNKANKDNFFSCFFFLRPPQKLSKAVALAHKAQSQKLLQLPQQQIMWQKFCDSIRPSHPIHPFLKICLQCWWANRPNDQIQTLYIGAKSALSRKLFGAHTYHH